MNIDLLYFDDCPSWQVGFKNLRKALQAEGLQAEIRLVLVEDDTAARRLKFCGSPSFHVDGSDLFPLEQEEYGMSCRVYTTPRGFRGYPSAEMLRNALQLRAASPLKHQE